MQQMRTATAQTTRRSTAAASSIGTVAPATTTVMDLATVKATYQRYKDTRVGLDLERSELESTLRQLDQRFTRQNKLIADLTVRV